MAQALKSKQSSHSMAQDNQATATHEVSKSDQDLKDSIASIPDVIQDVKDGKPIILIDDVNRENEGDLIFAAEKATPDLINFMIRQCGGFVCLPFERAYAERLELPLQPRRNLIDNQAYFTVSIEARYGVDTGVSSYDRWKTIQTAIADNAQPDDICTPGHVFPLLAMDGGVLEREGHTEACVDLAKLAGYKGAAVLCEIMNEDGTMARLPDLQVFAEKHGFKIATIEDLVEYRKTQDQS